MASSEKNLICVVRDLSGDAFEVYVSKKEPQQLIMFAFKTEAKHYNPEFYLELDFLLSLRKIPSSLSRTSKGRRDHGKILSYWNIRLI